MILRHYDIMILRYYENMLLWYSGVHTLVFLVLGTCSLPRFPNFHQSENETPIFLDLRFLNLNLDCISGRYLKAYRKSRPVLKCSRWVLCSRWGPHLLQNVVDGTWEVFKKYPFFVVDGQVYLEQNLLDMVIRRYHHMVIWSLWSYDQYDHMINTIIWPCDGSAMR